MIKIYFDNAATTHPKPDIVKQRLKELVDNGMFNIGRGSYKKGQEGLDLYESTKVKLARLCNGDADKIKFSASATIAFNELIYYLQIKQSDVVYITPFEHNAVARTLNFYKEKIGFRLEIIPYDSNLNLNIEKFEHMCLMDKPSHIFINHVSNVVGNIVDLKSILDVVEPYNTLSIVDGSQSLGLVNIDMKSLGINYLVFAGHKTLYGPFGIAGVISKEKFDDREMLIQGGNGSDSLNINVNNALEVGSPNILSIAGLNASIDWIESIGTSKILEHERHLRKKLVQGLKNIYDIEIYGEFIDDNKSTGIVSFKHNEYLPDELGQILDLDFDIAVRTGFHCAPYIHDLIESRQNAGTIRVSFGWFNTDEEIDSFLEILEDL